MNIVALIADNEVFDILYFEDSHPLKIRYMSGLFSDPIFVNCSNFPDLKVGDFYINSKFYLQENSEIEIHKQEDLSNQNNINVSSFAAISNNIVFGIMKIHKDLAEHDLVVAGLSSNPLCINASSYPDIEVGWIWDGQKFFPSAIS